VGVWPQFSSQRVFETPPDLTTHLFFSHLYVAGPGGGFTGILSALWRQPSALQFFNPLYLHKYCGSTPNCEAMLSTESDHAQEMTPLFGSYEPLTGQRGLWQKCSPGAGVQFAIWKVGSGAAAGGGGVREVGCPLYAPPVPPPPLRTAGYGYGYGYGYGCGYGYGYGAVGREPLGLWNSPNAWYAPFKTPVIGLLPSLLLSQLAR
jgi:hypothetical protein